MDCASDSPPAPPTHTAWRHVPPGRWMAVARGTEAECWRFLLHLEPRGQFEEKAVLVRGRRPRERASRR